MTAETIAELARLEALATPFADLTIMRYDHGGGRAFVDNTTEKGGRKLIANSISPPATPSPPYWMLSDKQRRR